jgi:hypothetical protein
LRFSDTFLEFERKHPGNEGRVPLTPSDDGLRLGGITRIEDGWEHSLFFRTQKLTSHVRSARGRKPQHV